MSWLLCILGVLALLLVLRILQRLRVERVSLTIPGLRRRLRIVQLSDIHWDFKQIRMTASLLNRAIDAANAEDADLILITGDFVQRDPAPVTELCTRFLARLRARHGVFAVLGNHDHLNPGGHEVITRELQQKAGITVLNNDSRMLPGLGVELVGVGDLSSRNCSVERAMATLSSSLSAPRIVMAHNPDTAALLRPYDVSLVLAGHTHGGQVRLPIVGTPVLALPKMLFSGAIRRRLPRGLRKYERVVKNWDWAVGLHRVPPAPAEERKHRTASGFFLYTSRGLATHPPLRLFCDPEVTVFELLPQQGQRQLGEDGKAPNDALDHEV